MEIAEQSMSKEDYNEELKSVAENIEIDSKLK